MGNFKKSLAVVTALVLVFAPLMQANQLSASEATADNQICGSSECCCCPTETVEIPSGDSSTRECHCSMSESDRPIDVEMSGIDNQSNRERVFTFSLTAVGDIFSISPPPETHYVKSSSQAGESPPVYILTCAFLI